MIIVKLMGGLGNQMFQYAAARRLAWRHATALKLDLSFFEGDQQGNTPRTFALDQFRITAMKASTLEIGAMCDKVPSPLARIFCRHIRYAWYREKCFHFDPQLLILPDNQCIEGYWQSSRYFADISDIIRDEFTVTRPLTGENRKLADEIKSAESIAVHVRRGDYVQNENTRMFHGVCDIDYYLKAEELLAQRLTAPRFFVFSDDPDWAVDNLRLNHPASYVNHNGSDQAHEDLRLMSMCRHHIIANSSFSWWGAWLSNSHDKMVVAPKRWFSDTSIDTNDLIPPEWFRI